ncbi:ankyrin repeat domain-containing protein, partial [Campylobacter helveticus]|uniref:ankyrin repeat domain-containing protein n=1 Tax=Campylobacter helveticus TaxID=28898 RepID=UPI00214A7353
KNQPATQKLYQISNQIRGNSSICSGITYFDKLREFQYLLLEIALSYQSYQKKLEDAKILEERNDVLKTYFRYWAYQSIGNYRLYREFWKEYNNAIEPLGAYFEKNFKLDKGSNIYFTSNALNEFLVWAVGESKIQKDIGMLAKMVANKNYDEVRLEQYIIANSPSLSELNLALRSALLNGRETKIINMLLKFGLDLNEGYESAIFYALENKQNVEFLIQKGANVNHANAFGKTPLFYALEFNQDEVAKLLIEKGANVNAKYINNNEKLALNSSNTTPYFITLCALEHTSKNVFMHAASYSNVSMLKLLVEKKVDIFAVDDLGFNALDFALMADKQENAAYLRSLGLKENENLFYGERLE